MRRHPHYTCASASCTSSRAALSAYFRLLLYNIEIMLSNNIETGATFVRCQDGAREEIRGATTHITSFTQHTRCRESNKFTYASYCGGGDAGDGEASGISFERCVMADGSGSPNAIVRLYHFQHRWNLFSPFTLPQGQATHQRVHLNVCGMQIKGLPFFSVFMRYFIVNVSGTCWLELNG